MAVTIVGAAAGASNNGTTNHLITFRDPPALDGDLQYVALGMQATAQATEVTNDRGMTRVGMPFVANDATVRYHGVWILGVPSKAAMPPNVQFGPTTAGARKVSINALLRGVNLASPVDVASSAYASTGTTARTITALTPTVDGKAIASFASTWASPNDHAVASVTAGWNLVLSYVEPVGGGSATSRNTVHVYERDVSAGVSTGPCTLTFVGTPAQCTGQMVVFRAAATLTAPGQVTGLDVVQSAPNTAALSWTAPASGGSAITGYKIERAPDSVGLPGLWAVLVPNTASTATAYSDTAATGPATWWYRVSAINAVGTGAASTADSVAITVTVTTPSVVMSSVTAVSSNGINPPAIPTPPLTDGCYIVVVLHNQSSTDTADYTNTQGFVRIGTPYTPPVAAGRYLGVFGCPVPVAAGFPSSIVFARPSAIGARQEAICFVVNGVDLAAEVPVGASSDVFSKSGAAAPSITASGIVVPGSHQLLLAVYGGVWAAPNPSNITTAPAGMTLVGTRLEPVAGDATVSRNRLAVYQQDVEAGGTGGRTLTFDGSATTLIAGLLSLRGVGSAPPPPELQFWEWTGAEWIGPLVAQVAT